MDDYREVLTQAISEAFANVSLRTGGTLRECVAADNYDYDAAAHPEYADISACTRWKDIPDHDLELVGTHGVLAHGGCDGAVFHLPAAMIYILKYYDGNIASERGSVVNAVQCAVAKVCR